MEDALPFERDAGTATLAEPHHHHHHYPPRLQPHGSEPSLLLRELCAADEEDGQGFEGILDLVLLQQRRRVKKEEGEGVGEEGGLLSEEERKGLEWAEVGYDKELHRAPLLRRLLSAFVHPPRLPPVDKEEEGPAAAIGGPLSRKRRREGEEEGGEEEEKGEAEPPLRTSGSTKGGGGKSSSGGHEKDKEKGAKGGGGGAQHAHFARPVASPIPSSSAVDGEAIGPLQVPQRELSGGNGSSGLPKQGRGLLADPSPRTPRGHTLEGPLVFGLRTDGRRCVCG